MQILRLLGWRGMSREEVSMAGEIWSPVRGRLSLYFPGTNKDNTKVSDSSTDIFLKKTIDI